MAETTLGNSGVKVPKATADLYGEDFYLFAKDGTIDTSSAGTSDGGLWSGFSDSFDFKTPSYDFGIGTSASSKTGKDTGGGFGSTLQGIGAVTGALASIYGIHEQKEYQDKVLGMEEKRVADNNARRDKQQAEYDKVWGA